MLDPPGRGDFLVSNFGNPAGRLRGSRNKLSEEVICALLRDFREHGQKAIAKVRRTQPAAYLKVLALLVPREHKVEHRAAAWSASRSQCRMEAPGRVRGMRRRHEPRGQPHFVLPPNVYVGPR